MSYGMYGTRRFEVTEIAYGKVLLLLVMLLGDWINPSYVSFGAKQGSTNPEYYLYRNKSSSC